MVSMMSSVPSAPLRLAALQHVALHAYALRMDNQKPAPAAARPARPARQLRSSARNLLDAKTVFRLGANPWNIRGAVAKKPKNPGSKDPEFTGQQVVTDQMRFAQLKHSHQITVSPTVPVPVCGGNTGISHCQQPRQPRGGLALICDHVLRRRSAFPRLSMSHRATSGTAPPLWHPVGCSAGTTEDQIAQARASECAC